MSWHFSAALEAEFLEVTSSDGAPSAQSSGCNTLGPSSCNDKMTESCDHSQSGTMSRPSTGARGLDAWMLSRVGFRARTSPQQEKERESTANAPECGLTWPESLAKYDPDSRSWKTAQCSLLAGLDEFSETWPRWGTMRNGACWARMTAEHLTGATESGFSELLPTPLASIATHGGPNQRDSSGRPGLQMAAMSWPTPRSNDTEKRGNFDVENPRNGLAAAAKLATPQARDFRTGSLARWEDPRRSRNLNDQIGGQLNPPWVEWLMGWPIGWTDSRPLEMDKFQSWQQAHSVSFPLASEQ